MRSSLKKRRLKRNVLSVSLFPFLAVLICTLGVLIVMLVMAAKSADVDAATRQADDDSERLQEVKQLEETADIQLATIEGLELVRPEALIRLEESRANRSHIEDEIRELKEEFQRVGDELVELDVQSKREPDSIEFSEEDNQQALSQLKSQIAQVKTELAEKRKVVTKIGPAKYQIVPHKGAGGTFRRPIFLECTKDAITLQPSGIRLLKSEFAPPLEPGNMVDSALITIREYWKRYDLAGEEGNPYPLIVIRPGGAQTFVLARRAMKSWDDEFGYELVEADTPLEFGKRDPQLVKEIQSAVASAKVRQRNRIARSIIAQRSSFGTGGQRSSRKGGRNIRPGLTASGPNGGFVATAGGFEESNHFGRGQGGVAQTSGQSNALDDPSDRYGENSFQSQQGWSSQRGQNRRSDFASQQSNSTQNFNSNSNSNSTSNSQSAFAQQSSNNQRSGQTSSSNGTASTNGASGGSGGESKFQNPYADQSLAQERGGNWALPTQTPGATGYLRPIRVVCYPDRFEVLSGTRNKQIPISQSTKSAIDPMVDAIWNQIEAWGVPGPNGYWKPQLRIKIAPGGRQRFLELKGLLYKSGLAVEESR